jgi:hypothetical protein
MEICQEMLQVLKSSVYDKRIILLQVIKVKFTEIIVTAGNGEQIQRPYLFEFISPFHRKTMISAYFSHQEFVSIEALPETERFN